MSMDSLKDLENQKEELEDRLKKYKKRIGTKTSCSYTVLSFNEWILFLLFFFTLLRKDIELAHLQAKIEDEQGLVIQLQKKLKEFQVC